MSLRLRRSLLASVATSLTCLLTMNHSTQFAQKQPTSLKAGRSVVRAQHGMVATSQPLASQVGLEVLKRGGNAVDAAIAMAAVLNVTEPMMTGVGGDMFALVYWAKTKELKGLNASGRAPAALSLDYFAKHNIKQMPQTGMGSITVPGAFDGVGHVTRQIRNDELTDLLAPAIDYAEHGFPVMEKTSEDWQAEVGKLKRTPAATSNYLIDGRAPRPGEIFVNQILPGLCEYCLKVVGMLSTKDQSQKLSLITCMTTVVLSPRKISPLRSVNGSSRFPRTIVAIKSMRFLQTGRELPHSLR